MRLANSPPTVATLLEPTSRPRLDAAAQGYFATVHAESVGDAIRAVRERPVDAVLVSPAYVPNEQIPRLAALVRGFPGVPTVAVVSSHDACSSERLLAIGASGVRRMVDLTQRDGWRSLRELVAEPVSPTSARIGSRVIPALGDVGEDCRLFFQALIRLAPGTATVRALAAQLGSRPSTFMSRFFRAGLPSPKRYLAATRILYAAALFELDGLSIADVAYRLEYSSPQSFGRHLRATTGRTAGDFRATKTFDEVLGEYCETLIVPHRPALRAFLPLRPNGIVKLGQRV